MRIISLLLTLSLCLTLGAQVKTPAAPEQRSCAAHDNHVRMMGLDPSYAAQHTQIEQQTADFVLARQKARASGAQWQPVVVTIPVVFHVVYANDAENIPDERLIEQLQILNDDFRRLNADQDDIWSQAADTEIEFCLASRDPDGAPSDGILRVQTTVSAFGSSDDVKFSSSGGSDAWPASDYLNFWVCDLGGGLLGYAQFPGGNPATDGIVCGYQFVGLNGPGAGAYNLGRTATHEVGHWLNLRHIWGDGGCGADDLVADTPESDGANYGCALGHISCGTEDMVQNYMDYSDDACMNVFSQGQADRMQALFAPGAVRASLMSSNGCLPAVPDFNVDAAINAVNSPSGFSCETEVPAEIRLFNNGGDTLTSATIKYSVDDAAETVYSWTGDLAFGESETVSLGILSPGDGDHTFVAAVTEPNGGVDENPSNDADSSAFTLDSQGTDVIMTLTLDDYPGETTWQLTNVAGDAVWTGGPYGGSGTVVESNCVADGCYTLTVFDSFGDGMCCAWGDGGYEFSVDGDIVASGGDFGDLDATPFCIGSGFGCTDNAACNFDPDATTDNGLCDYSCYGCTDPTSCNYDATATIDDGSCIGDGFNLSLTILFDQFPAETTWDLVDSAGAVLVSGGPYSIGDSLVVETFCAGSGCFTLTLYDSYGDGICCDYGIGEYELSLDGAVLVSGGAFDFSESSTFCLGNGYGCTDATACNYDGTATLDNGLCDFSCYGCTDPTSCNFDPEATLDDGSCISDGVPFALTLVLDQYPFETTWDVTDDTGAIVASGGPYGFTSASVTETFCAAPGCYTLTLYDEYGDGICCDWGAGEYELTVDGVIVASGGEFGLEDATSFCFGDGYGCTDSTACNYDPQATVDNGLCDFSCYGCTDSESCNYNPDATIDDGSCIGEGINVTVSIATDFWAYETTWTLSDLDGVVLLSGGPYTGSFTNEEESICLDDGCYVFEILDSYGDGIFDPGGYQLTIDGALIAEGGDFGTGETVEFCTDNLTFGCTDQAACNFNPEAGIDDGTCDYSCVGCTLPSACNYDPNATVDDGSCLFDDSCGVCGGDNSTCTDCTDPTACNYNPSATLDDGSCTYPEADNLDCDGNCLNDADNDGICDEDEEAPSSFVQLGYDVIGQNTVAGMTTYRVWVELADPTEQLVAVFGFDTIPMTINTTTSFYQNPFGGALAANYNPDLVSAEPLLEFDSWLTVGGADNTADVNTIGLDFAAFEGNGGAVVADDINGGSVFIYPDLEPAAFPDADGHVLIAQLTTDGEVSLTVNLQTRTEGGQNPQVLQQSLTFQEVYECFGDFNLDGFIGIGDLLMLLGDFGCPGNCNHDMTGDGAVTTADMLVMLSIFGTDCE